jgi:23S rRNA pseudouridine1911/1915/1917 synthase
MRPLSIHQILYEDNHLLIVNKPAGLLVQGDITGDPSLLDMAKAYVKEKYDKPGDVFMGLPHRLDRVTSGLVILARTSKALSRLSEAFRNKEIQKFYWMITDKYPEPQEAHLSHYLLKDPEKNKVKARKDPREGWQKAELDYKLIASTGFEHLLEVKLHTGKPHQIRAQMSAEGMTIVGDLKYGSKHTMPDQSICLHARRLILVHPVKKTEMEFVAPIPRITPWVKFEDWN